MSPLAWMKNGLPVLQDNGLAMLADECCCDACGPLRIFDLASIVSETVSIPVPNGCDVTIESIPGESIYIDDVNVISPSAPGTRVSGGASPCTRGSTISAAHGFVLRPNNGGLDGCCTSYGWRVEIDGNVASGTSSSRNTYVGAVRAAGIPVYSDTTISADELAAMGFTSGTWHISNAECGSGGIFNMRVRYGTPKYGLFISYLSCSSMAWSEPQFVAYAEEPTAEWVYSESEYQITATRAGLLSNPPARPPRLDFPRRRRWTSNYSCSAGWSAPQIQNCQFDDTAAVGWQYDGYGGAECYTLSYEPTGWETNPPPKPTQEYTCRWYWAAFYNFDTAAWVVYSYGNYISTDPVSDWSVSQSCDEGAEYASAACVTATATQPAAPEGTPCS